MRNSLNKPAQPDYPSITVGKIRKRHWLIAMCVSLWAIGVSAGETPSGEPKNQTKKFIAPKATHVVNLQTEGSSKSWGKKHQTAVAGFFTNGIAVNPDTTAIVDSSGFLPFKVIQNGPGDFVRIAFNYRTPSGNKILLGVKGAPKAAEWKRNAGLLLTAWPLPKGAKAYSWKDMEATLALAKKNTPYGSDFVDRVYQGYNPFADEATFVSLYEGVLGCPADGEYLFATSSDDASFLYIDDKPVVAWPGRHYATGDARHSKKIKLKKGIHKFKYCHVNFAGQAIMLAAWLPPGGKKIWMIAPESFAPVLRMRVAKFSATNSQNKITPIFEAKNSGEAWVGTKGMLRYRFALHGLADKKVRWDFGDGIAASGKTSVEHVYISTGIKTVTATWDGDKATNRVMIKYDPERSISRKYENAEKTVNEILAYPFASLPESDLNNVIYILTEMNNHPDKLLAACKAVLTRDNLSPRLTFDAAKTAGLLLRDTFHKPQEAVELYRNTLEQKKLGKGVRAHIIREIGDTLFYYIKDLDGALNEYDKVVGRYADALEANIIRVTRIKIGDIYRQKGNGKKAREVYIDAEKMKLFKRNFAQNTVRKGALYKAIDDFLKRNNTETAKKWLEILEWEYPLEKMDGYSSIARARIAQAEKNNTESLKQLLWFVAASPKNIYAAEALFMAGTIFKSQGKTDELNRIAAKLKEEYADSPYAEKARELVGANHVK